MSFTMQDPDCVRAQLARWREAGQRIALVPTMGALHEGHLSLARLAKTRAERVLATIFVNPLQFGAGEDLARYPRALEADLAKLRGGGVDGVYTPDIARVYPQGFATRVSVGGVSAGLCGADRPKHFDGVATIIAKLLVLTQPDVAVFGEKDYQQLQVIRRLVKDLDFETEIIGAPIVRETDGLAMSSRNAYLSVDERAKAPLLYGALNGIAARLLAGEPFDEAARDGRRRLVEAGFALDYLELRRAEGLAPLAALDETPARLLIAARLGTTRLIDNIGLERLRA